MILIVDANILFSALIKNSVTAEMLVKEELYLFTPEFILDELHKYEDLLLKKTSRNKEEYNQILQQLKEIMTVIPKEEYSVFMKEAEEISPDNGDIMYFALALKMKCPIWSNDKRLKEQKTIKIISTDELRNQIIDKE
jgi:predicted nucleic acid-binding protein